MAASVDCVQNNVQSRPPYRSDIDRENTPRHFGSYIVWISCIVMIFQYNLDFQYRLIFPVLLCAINVHYMLMALHVCCDNPDISSSLLESTPLLILSDYIKKWCQTRLGVDSYSFLVV